MQPETRCAMCQLVNPVGTTVCAGCGQPLTSAGADAPSTPVRPPGFVPPADEMAPEPSPGTDPPATVGDAPAHAPTSETGPVAREIEPQAPNSEPAVQALELPTSPPTDPTVEAGPMPAPPEVPLLSSPHAPIPLPLLLAGHDASAAAPEHPSGTDDSATRSAPPATPGSPEVGRPADGETTDVAQQDAEPAGASEPPIADHHSELPYASAIEALRPTRRTPSRRARVVALVAVLVLLGVTAMVAGSGGDGTADGVPTELTVVTDTRPAAADPDTAADAAGEAVWQVLTDGCGVTRTGTAVAVTETLLVTSFPVVVHDASPTLVSADGAQVEATLVHLQQTPDVAVLRVDRPMTAFLPIDAELVATPAQTVAVLGWPGEPPAFAAGSALVTGHRAGSSGPTHAITFDRDFAPADGGSALVDSEGRLLGTISLVGAADSGVAIPTAALAAAVETAASAEPVAADCGRGGFSPAPNDDWLDPGFGAADLEYGAEPVLDRLWDRCAAGESATCDDLAAVAAVSSSYANFAVTCGGITLPSGAGCAISQGGAAATRTPPHSVGACVVLPRRPGGSAVVVPCGDPHDAQVFATVRTSPVDPAIGPTAEQQAQYATVCGTEFTAFTATTTWWDLAWRNGFLAPAVDAELPTAACFAYVPGRSGDVPVAAG